MAGPIATPTLLHEVPARQAASRPDAAALQFEGDLWTYRLLAARCAAAAAVLQQRHGVRAGDRVAWLGLNHPGELVALFALARLGAALLPLNFRLAPAEWDAQLADCKPVAVLHDSTWADAAQALAARHGVPAVPVAALEADPAAALADAPAADADAPALLVYTSGTTGRPKAAVHTQANLLANMAIAAQVQALTAQDRVLTALPLFHVGGLCIQTLPALLAGATVVLHPRFDAGQVLEAVGSDGISLTLQVPATMKALAEHPRWMATDLSGLRAVWAGSSLLPAALVQAFLVRGVPLCNVYGATETGPFSIALPPGHAFDHAGSCGWPAPGVEVQLAPTGASGPEGELRVRGPNVVRHYWPHQPACDAQGWFHTGDLAVQAADGSYTVVGRARELIISGGENIHPAEIEECLAQHAAVAECAAFGLPDSQWGEVVAMAYVLRPESSATPAQLEEHLRARLARYKLPRRWCEVGQLPRTALGKLQRGALPSLLAGPR